MFPPADTTAQPLSFIAGAVSRGIRTSFARNWLNISTKLTLALLHIVNNRVEFRNEYKGKQ